MKRIILIALALLCVAPSVCGETAEEKAARVEAQRKARELEQKKRDLQNKIRAAERRKNDAANRLKGCEERLKKNGSDQWRANDRIKKAQENLKKALDRRAELKRVYQDRANEKQIQDADLAADKQVKLNEMIDLLRKILAAEEPRLEKLQMKEYEDNPLVRQQARQMAMSEAYEFAKQLEQEITESYKDIKTTQTAITHKMSFGAAQKLTDVAKPERRKVDAKVLESTPRNKEDLDRQKEAQREVIFEADKMVDATVQMMEEAMEIVMAHDKSHQVPKTRKIPWLEKEDFEKTAEERLAEMEAAAAFQVQMDSAAAEDDSQKAKDLAALMSELEATRLEAEEKEKEKKLSAADFDNSTPPPLDPKGKDILMGNVMQIAGTPPDNVIPAKWMYVSSWYVIGPFPNPNRINLRRKFPPESVVDLNATYAGKDGRVLKWQFMQTKNLNEVHSWGTTYNAPELVPDKSESYAIYYAYAEVFFDEECDRWIAIGSDDRSDVWVNDFHVWGSSNKLKIWRLNEDYRRVHFKKGRNRILLRCENGHLNVGWSMCIALEDGKPRL